MNIFKNSLLFFIIILFTATDLFSQQQLQILDEVKKPNLYQIQEVYNKYWEGVPLEQRRGWKQFNRWVWFWETRVNKDGSFPDVYNVYEDVEKFEREYKPKGDATQAIEWKQIGPFNAPGGSYGGIGRINVIRFNPNDANEMWAGAASGGVWKTTNGGSTWKTFNMTQVMSLGVSDIAVSKSNPNTVYVATGDADGFGSIRAPYSIGILKTTNSGASWEITNFARDLADGRLIGRLLINPDNENIVFAAAFDGIYKTTDGGVTWEKKQAGSGFVDMEFNPANPDIIYVSTKITGTNRIYKSEDGGETWSQSYSVGSTRRIAIAVSPDQPDWIFALIGDWQNTFHSLVRSTDAGENWVTMSSDKNSPDILSREDGITAADEGQASYDLALAVDPDDAGVVFAGGINIWRSFDEGASWDHVTHWYKNNKYPYVHADIHDIQFSPDGLTIFSTHDGGIDRSKNYGDSWTSADQDISVTQYYDISVSQLNENTMLGGCQDNGTSMMKNGSWIQVLGGDGMQCMIDYTNDQRVYGSLYYGDFRRSVNGGQSFPYKMINRNKTTQNAAWVTPIVMDPVNPANIYAGYTDVWKSTNYGASWTMTTTFGNRTALRILAVAYSNPQVVYAATLTKIWKSTNGGGEWNVLSSSLTNMTSITVDPQNANRIWVTVGGYSANSKVWEYDGTQWINRTGNLPNVAVNCAIYQKDSPDRVIIGTDIGVFFSDYNSAYWERFGSGLPNLIVTDLEIQENMGLLRAGTYSRGIWEAPLMDCNLPQPGIKITGSLEFCEGDSVVLEADGDYSDMIWSNGETNKKIVIKEPGSYSLLVEGTDGCKAKSEAVNVVVHDVNEINIRGTTGFPLCEGDEEINVKLSATIGFSDYLWSTGEKDRTIVVNQLGTYRVTGYTSFGCESSSEDFVLEFYPLPPKATITIEGKKLISSEAAKYQWYKNGEKISGAQQREYIVTENANYSVETYNDFGCSILSDEVFASYIEDVYSLKAPLSISPNPNDGLFRIKLTLNNINKIKLNVTGVLGQVLFTDIYENTKQIDQTIDLQKFPSGVYFLNISTPENFWTARIIKR